MKILCYNFQYAVELLLRKRFQMKNYLLSAMLILCVSIVIASNKNKGNSIAAVNANDTIVINLANQTMANGKISFPVSIISDDTIYALDFSFKYDQTNFTYDTILNLSPLLQSSAYYNTNDSTVRYTSFSLDSLSKNTDLVTVRFNTFSSYMCSQDINTIKGFLNGDACSIKLINCLTAGISDANSASNTVSVYPNPSSQLLNITSAQNASMVLYDLNGKIIVAPTSINKDQKSQLNVSGVVNGIYFLKVYNDNFVTVKKVMINK